MKQYEGFWAGFTAVGLTLGLFAAPWLHLTTLEMLSFPIVVAPAAGLAGHELGRRASPLRSWPIAVGLLAGFTVVGSVLMSWLGDDFSDVRASNYVMFAPWLSPLACGPAILALVITRLFTRARTAP